MSSRGLPPGSSGAGTGGSIGSGPQVTLEALRADRETWGHPRAWWAELGALPDRLQAKEREISVGVDAAGTMICMASSHAAALLPYLGSSETGSRKETEGPRWSRVGSCLSGRTFQNVE